MDGGQNAWINCTARILLVCKYEGVYLPFILQNHGDGKNVPYHYLFHLDWAQL